MNHFNTDLERYFNYVLKKKEYSIILQDLLTYISKNNYTILGINNILESYNLSNIKSLKLELLDFYGELKKVIIKEENHLKSNHIKDLELLKTTCQITEKELNKYNSNRAISTINDKLYSLTIQH